MTLKTCVGVFLLSVLGALTFVGCSNDSLSSAADAGADAAITDAKSAKDVAVPGDDDDDAGSCSPSDQTNFKPKWHGPSARKPACTDLQIQGYHACLQD